MQAIERLLADDAVLEMTGTTTWFSGKATCVPFIAAQAIGQAGDWRMIPLLANGQLAAAAYHLGNDGYRPFAIVVLSTTLTHLNRIALFAQPGLFDRFELPATIAAGRVTRDPRATEPRREFTRGGGATASRRSRPQVHRQLVEVKLSLVRADPSAGPMGAPIAFGLVQVLLAG